jgi:hypothetical protein
MKRISPFDDAQNGEPVEPYLANKGIRHENVLSVVRFTLHEIRATKNRASDHRL